MTNVDKVLDEGIKKQLQMTFNTTVQAANVMEFFCKFSHGDRHPRSIFTFPFGKSRKNAKNIKKHFDCNVFHMDDFFLPAEKKTEERLATPGGNVDWERFKEQVLDKIRTNEPFTYDIYHCGTGDVTKSKVITPKRLNIVEGVYAMHPELREAYEYELFFDVARPKQLDRIKKRSSDKMLKRFVDEWIPLEDVYFKTFNTKKEADFCFDTTRAF